MAPNFKVFLSYSRRDADSARRLAADLRQGGIDVWMDTQRTHAGTSWTQDIERAIDGCDALLALITKASYESAICRAEQLRALRKDRCVIPVLVERGADRPLHLEGLNYCDPAGVVQALRDGSGERTHRFHVPYVTAPPLPRNYVERPEEIARLRQVLIVDEPGPSVAVTALKGMGGIGKTVLAQALAHDEAVRDAFPDGIAWSTVGKESTDDFVTRMREVRRALGDEPGDKETQLECMNRYRTLMQQKAALVIVDDVWRTDDVEPFVAESPRSRLLFTTRDGSIASAVGADEWWLDVLSPEKARELLARWAGLNTGTLPKETADVIRECGGLPLALSMVGAMLRGKPASHWSHVVGLLRHARLDHLSAPAGYAHKTLVRAIQVSVENLDEQTNERYVRLAVMLEDMPVRPAVQQTLWEADEADALNTALILADRSLAQRDGEDGTIRLHDLQLDYVRALYPDKDVLELIHGAMRLSAHVVEKDPRQFASQVAGRLLPRARARSFVERLASSAPRPWVRLMHPALHPPGTGLIRTLTGHSGPLNGVAVTPEGRRAVSASTDKTLKVWDLQSGRELFTLEGHSGWVTAVAVTPDGRRAVSASDDHMLKVWCLESGSELLTLKGHSYAVAGVAVTADGRRAVSASDDHMLKVWDLESGRELLTLEGHSESVSCVAVTPDGRRAVSASADKTLKVWDLQFGLELLSLEGHSGRVTGVAVTPDGRRAVSASWDKTLKVWDLQSGRELLTFKGHSWRVADAAVTPDRRRAVSASWDKTLKVWDLESGRELLTLGGHAAGVTSVAVTPDGLRAVSASGDGTLKVWDLESDRELLTLEGRGDPVIGVAVTPGGGRAVSASGDSTLKLWDLGSGRELLTLRGHAAGVTSVAVTADGRRAVAASYDNTLKVWDLQSARELLTLRGHAAEVSSVAVTPDGRRAVSTSDKTLKVWNLESGREVFTLGGHANWVRGVAVTPDGRRAVSASYDHTLKVWDLESGQELRTLEGHVDCVISVAVTPDGRRAVSASQDNTLKVWDLESALEVLTLEGHADAVTGVAVTPDGRSAVSASWDRTLKVWKLDTGNVVATFTCDAVALCCACAGDRTIVAGDVGGRVYFLALEE
jgi:WD40 repeat protein